MTSFTLQSLTKKTSYFLLAVLSPIGVSADTSSAKAINNTGFINSATQFSGSVSNLDGTTAALLTTSANEPVEVKMSITVDSLDVGKMADILLVIGTEPAPEPYSGNEDTRYMAFTATTSTAVDLYAAPRVWMAQLSEPYMQGVVLPNQLSLQLGQWFFDTEAMNYLFVGYRLDDGTIVYPEKPLMVQVMGSGETTPPVTDEPTTTPTEGSEPTEFAGIIAAHNTWRKQVNVLDLTWSEDAAKLAQGWANSLQEQGCVMQHNPNRGFYGENIYWSSGFTPTAQQVVDAWGSEISDYDYANNRCAEGKVCGHYTQVVWRDTQQVGCGKATCGNQQVWVCNYSPPGNYIGQKPY